MTSIILTIAAGALALPVAIVLCYLAARGWVHVWDLMTEEMEE
jgi:hypothetical protein